MRGRRRRARGRARRPAPRRHRRPRSPPRSGGRSCPPRTCRRTSSPCEERGHRGVVLGRDELQLAPLVGELSPDGPGDHRVDSLDDRERGAVGVVGGSLDGVRRAGHAGFLGVADFGFHGCSLGRDESPRRTAKSRRIPARLLPRGVPRQRQLQPTKRIAARPAATGRKRAPATRRSARCGPSQRECRCSGRQFDAGGSLVA